LERLHQLLAEPRDRGLVEHEMRER
jgi:hypothetical protein